MNRQAIITILVLVVMAVSINQSTNYTRNVQTLSKYIQENEYTTTFRDFHRFGITSVSMQNQPFMQPVAMDNDVVQITGSIITPHATRSGILQYKPEYRGSSYFVPLSRVNIRSANLQRDVTVLIGPERVQFNGVTGNRKSLMLEIERLELWGSE